MEMRVVWHGLTKETFGLCVNKVVGTGPPVWGPLAFHPLPGDFNWEGVEPRVDHLDAVKARLFIIKVPVLGAVDGRLSVKGNGDQSCGDVALAAWCVKKAEDSKDACQLTGS